MKQVARRRCTVPMSSVFIVSTGYILLCDVMTRFQFLCSVCVSADLVGCVLIMSSSGTNRTSGLVYD